ncbi:MAG: hypothetical protein QM606_03450 [Leucobacter sp.]
MNVSLQIAVNTILILLLLVWVGYRQTTWRAVDPSRMWRMPAILAIVGLATLGDASDIVRISGIDLAVLLAELVLSFGIGALMGAISRFRLMSAEAADAYLERLERRGRTAAPVSLEARTGWAGLVLWIVLIAVRVGLDVLAVRMGSELAASTGVILLMVAANRAARVAVILARSGRFSPQPGVASGTY